MQLLKDFIGVFDERVKSPFYTFILVSFLLINWQPIYLLLFADLQIASRITYFHMKTDLISLLVYPVLLGTAGALFSPWLSYMGSWWAEGPTKKKKLRQVRVAVEIRKARTDFENAVNLQVDAAIKSALQDQAIQQIDDDELREKITTEVENLRSEIRAEFGENQNNSRKSSSIRNAERVDSLRNLRKHYDDTGQSYKLDEIDKKIEHILRMEAKI